ncbi:MAG: cytochrome c biogenesis protein CcsA [Candidatus Omnitrophica bacterium]|nr:cytochrome c biogenesis protein CcsA [Candidatus Omnitrophota bacterium]
MSLWLVLHITCVLLSYAAFLVAFGSGALFLLQERQLKHKQMGLLFHRLPALGTLDRINVLAIGWGFALLSLGIAVGAAVGHAVTGRWWNVDLKIYGALLLWAVYLALWLLRVRATLRGRTVAVLSVLGFGLALIIWLGVNHALLLGPLTL